MPNRIIKESICTSKNLNRLTAEEEVFFYRLIVNADDYGRFDADPEILRSRCYPRRTDQMTVTNIQRLLYALQEAELISLYEVDSEIYGYFITWDDHQQKRAQHSKYPDPDLGETYLISDDINCNQPQSNVPENRETRIRESRNENRKTHTPKSSKIQYAEFVTMTEEEYSKLIDEHGPEDTARMIEILNNYKGSSGKNYKSDYLAILNWVVKRLEEEKKKVITLTPKPQPEENPVYIPPGLKGG